MSESLLKKEFKGADLQRLRNLVQGKTGDKTTVSVGYTKDKKDYVEGDIWEEDGLPDYFLVLPLRKVLFTSLDR